MIDLNLGHLFALGGLLLIAIAVDTVAYLRRKAERNRKQWSD